RAGFSYPSAVAIDPVSGWVWISDNGAGNVAILNPWSGAMTTLPGFIGPSTLAVDANSHSGWVCDEEGKTVWEFAPTGLQLGAPITPIEIPLGISVDPNDGSVWIAERGASRLRHYAASHSLLGTAN